jgi:hypothetical protein
LRPGESADLPYRGARPAPPAPPGLPCARRRLPHALERRGPRVVKGANPRAWSASGLCGRSRLLEFPIQIRVAEAGHLRGTRPAHAPLHNEVGGYMRGEAKERQKWCGAWAIAAPGQMPCAALLYSAAMPSRALLRAHWRAGCSACPGTPALEPVPSHHRPLTRGFHGPLVR